MKVTSTILGVASEENSAEGVVVLLISIASDTLSRSVKRINLPSKKP